MPFTFENSGAYLRAVQVHFDTLLASGLATYGKRPCAMWMASLDTGTGRYPENDARPTAVGKRVYRNIDAPRGCSLYWDQPSIVAAHALCCVTGESRYAAAADAYVRDFLNRCVSFSNMFLWGNHYYYDAFRESVVRFVVDEDPVPCDPAADPGDLHEIRPIPPAWGSFWRVSPEMTESAIRAAAAGHVVDPATGEFQRHAEHRRGCAFLEAGGILVESLAWLFEKTGDAGLANLAGKIAGYSFRHRHPVTGLLENNPTATRWDKHTATTEVGLWANSLMRASERTGRSEWLEMADLAVSSWLRFGYDASRQQYYGRLAVADGRPILGAKTTPYQPRDYSDIWEPLFPTHDYPLCFAEACLSLFAATGREEYLVAAERWSDIIQETLLAPDGRGRYAEQYGRCIHFLLRLEKATGKPRPGDLTARIAHEAMSVLFTGEMFRGHPGENRYDAVDGVGFLLLALIQLGAGQPPPDLMGLGW